MPVEGVRRAGLVSSATSLDVLEIAHILQAELWVRMCEQFVEVVGGRQIGLVQINTERTRS